MTPKNILLAVTGGIAAYKSCELVRLLVKAGHRVEVAMSRAACGFIHPRTFQALSGNPVLTDAQPQDGGGMAHIDATRRADVLLIAPATADTLAKIAHGIADNLITEAAAARNCPLVVAPAMNVEMWRNPANRRNVAQLQQDGVIVLHPADGSLACGETGTGRMREAAEIAELLADVWQPKTLRGRKVLITLGAGYEAIDPVRGITNISSGLMGAEIARACRAAGAEVSLVHGRMDVVLPAGMASVEQALGADAMLAAVQRKIAAQDVFIAVAAVADYKAASYSENKLKKSSGSLKTLALQENPDILATIAARPDAPFCVGFAAESENVLAYARAKKTAKNLPMIIANEVSVAMGTEKNRITIIDDEKETALPESSKIQAAYAIVARLAELLPAETANTP